MPRPDHKYFAIFGAMRTGSNLLEYTLDSYRGLTGVGELFNDAFVGKPNGDPYLGVSLAERNRDPLGFLADVIEAEKGVPGFRIFPGHDAQAMDHAARDPACAKIILRRSPVDSFISLQIAKKTGQWMLKKEENRRLVKVHFDIAAFEDYRDELAAHYAALRRKMHLAGQVPFEISYEDLRDVDVINGLARFIGAKEQLKAAPQKIQRQNPPAWEDKVSNADELRSYIGVAPAKTVFDTAPPRFVATEKLVASRGFSLIYAPVPGAGAEAIRSFIREAETQAGVSGKPLANGLNEAHIARRRRRGGFAFSFIRHPALRALDVFQRRFVATGEGTFPSILEVLIQRYGAPDAAKMFEDRAAFGVGFDAFIAFIADNLAGRTSVREDPSWASQVALLAAFAREAPVDFTGRCERAVEDITYVLSRLGVDDPHGALARKTADELTVTAGEVITPARERRLLEIYAEDYARLGYSPLPGNG
ncbi:MAG: sulfotransferase family 2 domain-containing protein [Pikeienuella sp.]